MNVDSFSIEKKSGLDLSADVQQKLSNSHYELIVCYSNCLVHYQEIATAISRHCASFLVSSSCLGALHCNADIQTPSASVSMFCISDENGAYGVGSAEVSNSTAFEAGKNAILNALENAKRPFESPSLIWCALCTGEEEQTLRGIASVVGEHIPVFGGSCADNTVSGEWYNAAQSTGGSDTVIVAVMYPSTPISFSYSSGYKPTDTTFTLTKAVGRKLVELNGLPASIAYNDATNGLINNQLSGGQILGLTSSAPLGRPVTLNNGAVNYLLCHPDQVDENGALNVFSEVLENEELVLMEGSISSLTARAERVVSNAIMLLPEGRKPVGVLMIYCAGCRLMVGDEIDKMLVALHEEFDSIPFCGTFTFGEQGRFLDGRNRHGNLMISAVVFSV